MTVNLLFKQGYVLAYVLTNVALFLCLAPERKIQAVLCHFGQHYQDRPVFPSADCRTILCCLPGSCHAAAQRLLSTDRYIYIAAKRECTGTRKYEIGTFLYFLKTLSVKLHLSSTTFKNNLCEFSISCNFC